MIDLSLKLKARFIHHPRVDDLGVTQLDGSENVPNPEFCSLSWVIWYRAVKLFVGVSCTSTLGLKFVRVRGFEIDSITRGMIEFAVRGLGSWEGSMAEMAEKSSMLRREASRKNEAFLLIGPPRLPSKISEL